MYRLVLSGIVDTDASLDDITEILPLMGLINF